MKQEMLQHTDKGRTDDSRVADSHRSGDQPTPVRASDGQSPSSPLRGRDSRLPKVIGPDGKAISLGDLPPPDTKRWVIRRKAEVVAAVRGVLISLDEACQRYTLSVEEFLSWQRAIESFGLSGLRTTRLQRYRTSDKPEDA